MKQFAEVVQRLGAVTLLTDDHVRPQPVKYIFVVIIDRAAVVLPSAGSHLHGGNAVGRILQIAPDAARTMIQVRRNLRQRITSRCERALAAARGEHISQV